MAYAPVFLHELYKVPLRGFRNQPHARAKGVLLRTESVVRRNGTRHLHRRVGLVLDRSEIICRNGTSFVQTSIRCRTSQQVQKISRNSTTVTPQDLELDESAH